MVIITRVIPVEAGPINILNSSWSVLLTVLPIKLIRLGRAQNVKGINKSLVKDLIQFIDTFILVAGSNVLNRLVIMVSLFDLLFFYLF